MKKYMLVSLVMAFLLVTVVGPCLAGTVANTSKKGSLLIFPLIRTDFNAATGEAWETLITIANDNFYSVEMQCVFVIKDQNCDHLGNQFDFILTANQPVTFRASDGYDLDGDDFLGGGIEAGHVAEAKCWVKRFVFDDEDSEETSAISYNHLTGEATLLRNYGSLGAGAATYSAWRFAANATMGKQVGTTPGTLQLSGDANNYDSCPAALIFDYLKQVENPISRVYEGAVDNYVAIVPCKQDFTQDGGPTVMKLDVARRDENERSQNGALCLNCFVADSLANAPYFPDLSTPAGAFKVTPYANVSGGTECKLEAGVDAYPVVGVILKKFEGFLGPITAVTPTGVGEWVSGPAGSGKGVAAISFPAN